MKSKRLNFEMISTKSQSVFSAENLYYPVSNKNELLTFLKQVDAKLLTEKTFQVFYYPGMGRKTAKRIWTAVIESNINIIW